jgi:hypothetical protein
MIFITWHLFGVIGVCIITYFDVKADCKDRTDHLLSYLLMSLVGGIVFIFSLWVLKEEMRYSRENFIFDKEGKS